MKNYTKHFLMGTVVTLALGFTGLEYMGDTIVRFMFLIFAIGLFISCLDAVLISKRMHRIRVKEKAKDVRK